MFDFTLNYDQVLPNVFVGSFPQTPEDIDLLKRLGVTAVLNLQTDDDYERLDCNWRKLRAHYKQAKIAVRRVPVQDFDGDDLRRHLPACVQTLNELLRDDHVVYVHCTAGLGRSPTVVITYLHWIEQRELDVAVEMIVSCRPCSPNLDAIRLAGEDLLSE
jgi:protein-tyrosine phosphatase